MPIFLQVSNGRADYPVMTGCSSFFVASLVVGATAAGTSEPELVSVANLPTLFVPNRCDASARDQTVVLLHGYGTSEPRLRRLARSYAKIHCARLLFPEGPIRVERYGRAWWRAPAKGWRPTPSGWHDIEDGLGQARTTMVRFLAEVKEKFAVPSRALVLVGFSQGATLAVDVTIRARVSVGALLLCSGRFGGNPAWNDAAQRLDHLSAIVTHGTADRIAPFWASAELTSLLSSYGAAVEFLPYAGGHHPPRLAGVRLHGALKAAFEQSTREDPPKGRVVVDS